MEHSCFDSSSWDTSPLLHVAPKHFDPVTGAPMVEFDMRRFNNTKFICVPFDCGYTIYVVESENPCYNMLNIGMNHMSREKFDEIFANSNEGLIET